MANLDKETNFDAERVAEDIATGEKQKPRVNVESDYERSKEFAVADIDKTESSRKAAKIAAESQFKVPPQSSQSNLESTSGDPNEFLGMAKEVKPSEDK